MTPKPRIIRRSSCGVYFSNALAKPHSELYADSPLNPRPAFDRTISREEFLRQLKLGAPMWVCQTQQNN